MRFRERGVFFEGDAKFFEIFVRETISQIVCTELEEALNSPGAIAAKRSRTVQSLLVYEVDQLIRYLIRAEDDFVVVEQVSSDKKNN